jgi:biotin carboxyl carrier protein
MKMANTVVANSTDEISVLVLKENSLVELNDCVIELKLLKQ